MMSKRTLVLSFLYPNDAQPIAGVFVRERIVRVSRLAELFVISPQPWSPFDGLIRRFVKPGYRPWPSSPDTAEDGFQVIRPRFLSVPGVLRSADGLSMAISVYLTLYRRGLVPGLSIAVGSLACAWLVDRAGGFDRMPF